MGGRHQTASRGQPRTYRQNGAIRLETGSPQISFRHWKIERLLTPRALAHNTLAIIRTSAGGEEEKFRIARHSSKWACAVFA